MSFYPLQRRVYSFLISFSFGTYSRLIVLDVGPLRLISVDVITLTHPLIYVTSTMVRLILYDVTCLYIGVLICIPIFTHA